MVSLGVWWKSMRDSIGCAMPWGVNPTLCTVQHCHRTNTALHHHCPVAAPLAHCLQLCVDLCGRTWVFAGKGTRRQAGELGHEHQHCTPALHTSTTVTAPALTHRCIITLQYYDSSMITLSMYICVSMPDACTHGIWELCQFECSMFVHVLMLVM